MAAMSDFLENKIVDHIFRGQTYTTPSAMWVALYTTTPTDVGGGTEVVNGNNYSRVAYTPGLLAWKGTHGTTTGVSSGTSGTITNANTITFGVPSGNWGVINGFALMDTATQGTGNTLFYGALTTPKTVNANDAAPSFAVDALSIQIDN
jgi:hypothetical protein